MVERSNRTILELGLYNYTVTTRERAYDAYFEFGRKPLAATCSKQPLAATLAATCSHLSSHLQPLEQLLAATCPEAHFPLAIVFVFFLGQTIKTCKYVNTVCGPGHYVMLHCSPQVGPRLRATHLATNEHPKSVSCSAGRNHQLSSIDH